MTIRILPDNLINQIAAGEVIERPASVIKELVENAIDAGAETIEVTLAGGGKNLIIVSDDGKGMSKDELNLAVERHATSKLPDDDLFNIKHLGFRGEALPSIAAVSRMIITTRQADAENGWKLEINGGRKSEIMPAALSKGTRIEVHDLFYATPARLKFLKADSAEAAQCVDILNRIAMANPHVSFYLTSEGRRRVALNACQGELFDARLKRLSEVMGKEFAENSILIDASREHIQISGYVSLPTLNKANSLSQYLFVNSRPVRDKLLLGAIKGAYQDVLASNRYPLCALFIDVNPAYVDVNVHPAKAEVRFYDSGAVRGLLVGSIRHGLSLGDKAVANTLDLSAFVHDNIPDFAAPETVPPASVPERMSLSEEVYEMKMPASPVPPTFKTLPPFSAPRHYRDTLPELERLYSVRTEETEKSAQALSSPPADEIGPLGLAKAQVHGGELVLADASHPGGEGVVYHIQSLPGGKAQQPHALGPFPALHVQEADGEFFHLALIVQAHHALGHLLKRGLKEAAFHHIFLRLKHSRQIWPSLVEKSALTGWPLICRAGGWSTSVISPQACMARVTLCALQARTRG